MVELRSEVKVVELQSLIPKGFSLFCGSCVSQHPWEKLAGVTVRGHLRGISKMLWKQRRGNISAWFVRGGREFKEPLAYMYFYMICMFLEHILHSIPFWLPFSRAATPPPYASFFLFPKGLTVIDHNSVGYWYGLTNLILRKQSTMLTKYLETCQNVVCNMSCFFNQ